MHKKVLIIGAGFSGLSCACILAKNGFQVTIIEKNHQSGGRCNVFHKNGFIFDMGPSWYWMPDVFESFYNKFNYKASDFYELIRLDPSYQVIFDDEIVKIPAIIEELKKLFEHYENGITSKLEQFIKASKLKYEIGMEYLVKKPSLSIVEFITWKIVKNLFQLNLFSSFSEYIKKYFSHPKILQLLEFPLLFLGAKPKDIPALYSLMNYADLILGTWYPKGGMYEIVKAFDHIAKENEVKILYNQEVKKINTFNNQVKSIETNLAIYDNFHFVVSATDYHHIETLISDQKNKNYSELYWEKRKFAPSCFLYYLGINKKILHLEHHNLFFDTDFELHSTEIYDNKSLPTKPLFYVCSPSKTDDSVAPKGKENLFILIPIPTGIKESKHHRDYYLDLALKRIEKRTGETIKNLIIFKKDFATSDFFNQYNAYKGNAYGLANTLYQTAIFKPKIQNNSLNNLYYCGQMTIPGPGIPPCIISGEIIANQIIKR